MIYIKKKDNLILLNEDEISAMAFFQQEKKVFVFRRYGETTTIEDVESVTTTETLRVEIDRLEDMRKSHQMMLEMFTKMQDMKNSNTKK